MSHKCFVMQPFDKGKFDDRYNEIFKNAIKEAGFEPYRVDEDKSVTIPISDIEKNIRESVVCFAEITTDNPNVWYELGYAFACNKQVIMVCSDERKNEFPFDIRHRLVLTYKVGMPSGFKTLGRDITEKMLAIKKTAIEYPSPTKQKEETINLGNSTALNEYEVAIMFALSEHCFNKEDFLSVNYLKSTLEKEGFTPLATSLGIKKLSRNTLLNVRTEFDEYNNGESYSVCSLTEAGDEWIVENCDRAQLRILKSDNSLPF